MVDKVNPQTALKDLRQELEKLQTLREKMRQEYGESDAKRALYIVNSEIGKTLKAIAKIEVQVIRGDDSYL